MNAPQLPPAPERGLEQDLRETVNIVKKEVPMSLSGMERLPLHLLLVLLGAGLSVLLGLLFFFVNIFGSHPGYAIINLLICFIFGGLLLLSFIIAKRNILSGGILAGIFSLVLIIGGGAGGLIGGFIALGGAGIMFLKEFGIIGR